MQAVSSLKETPAKVYEIICRRFLSIFYPSAVYQKVSLTTTLKGEKFFSNFKLLSEVGYLEVAAFSFARKNPETKKEGNEQDGGEETGCDTELIKMVRELKKGMTLETDSITIKEGETSPPKRYNSGTMILAMENAGQLIEDEELRAQIKGSGIGTSATRAEILKKLVNIEYLNLNKKTQILTPTLMGEMIYDVVDNSIRPLLDPALTASWEKGLTMVADGTISSDEYMKKLDDFVSRRTNIVRKLNNQSALYGKFQAAEGNYKK